MSDTCMIACTHDQRVPGPLQSGEAYVWDTWLKVLRSYSGITSYYCYNEACSYFLHHWSAHSLVTPSTDNT